MILLSDKSKKGIPGLYGTGHPLSISLERGPRGESEINHKHPGVVARLERAEDKSLRFAGEPDEV